MSYFDFIREEPERLLPLKVEEWERWPYRMTTLMTLAGIQSTEVLIFV